MRDDCGKQSTGGGIQEGKNERGSRGAWLEAENAQLRVDTMMARVEPLCRLCLEAGRVTPATVADHVEPHRGNFTAFRLGQLRSLCADCHNRLDGTNSPRAPVREDGTPSDPNHSWNARS